MLVIPTKGLKFSYDKICEDPGNVTITKHNLRETPKEGKILIDDKTNITFETSGTQTKKNCNRKIALECSLEKLLGDNKFYCCKHVYSISSSCQVQFVSI